MCPCRVFAAAIVGAGILRAIIHTCVCIGQRLRAVGSWLGACHTCCFLKLRLRYLSYPSFPRWYDN